MSKNEIKIEYEEIEVTPDDFCARIFRSLNRLIDLDDIYDKEV